MASSSAAVGKKNIILKSSDGKLFEEEEAVAKQSMMICEMINLGCTEGSIPLPNITDDILSMVVKYLKKHAVVDDKELDAWDADYMNGIQQDTLYCLLIAADYLNIQNLLNLCCQTVVNMINGKSVGEIGRMFNIGNDFSPKRKR